MVKNAILIRKLKPIRTLGTYKHIESYMQEFAQCSYSYCYVIGIFLSNILPLDSSSNYVAKENFLEFNTEAQLQDVDI